MVLRIANLQHGLRSLMPRRCKKSGFFRPTQIFGTSLHDRFHAASSRQDQSLVTNRWQHRPLDCLTGGSQGVCAHEGSAFLPVGGEVRFQRAKVTDNQGSLVGAKGTRAVMAHIDRGRANVAKALFSRPQAEIGVFEISSVEPFGERADRIETSAGHKKGKTE